MSELTPSVSPSASPGATPGWVWPVLATLVSALVGVGGGILSYAGGEGLVPAVKSGFGAFTAVMLLFIAIIAIFHNNRR